jgi:nitrate reductase gamma subunit
VAHEAHSRVSCQACHLKNALPVKAAESDEIGWQIDRRKEGVVDVHALISSKDEAFCRRCHFQGSTIGAAAMILPPKGLICLPCHAATFSVGDTTTVITLIFFGLGIIGVGSVCLSGTLGRGPDQDPARTFPAGPQRPGRLIFSRPLISFLTALALDGLLQRRLFRISRSRWLNHALIFFPFLIRFSWGMTALAASLWRPAWPGVWIMLDKNHPLTALVFDLSGALFLSGFILILVKKYGPGSKERLKGLPRADWPAYVLMAGIMVIGFILEGLRIAMTGTPAGSEYAFLGWAVSRFLTGFDLTGIYGYIWYLHAFFTGAFVIYLPFSRLFHMIMAPVVLALNADQKTRKSS